MPVTNKTSSPQPRKSRAIGTKSLPTPEEIAFRAYQIYLDRNGATGNAFEDWTRAERELLAGALKPRRKPSPKSQAA